jgi:hypothetical protein
VVVAPPVRWNRLPWAIAFVSSMMVSFLAACLLR